MVLQRNGQVDLIVREKAPIGKADTLTRVQEAGGHVHAGAEVSRAEFSGDQIDTALSDGTSLRCEIAIVQIDRTDE